MNDYVPTIGLEIHAELNTRTKMFCRSKNDPNETRHNVNICPVCLAHPGTLPVINAEAVKHVLRVGLALKAKLADYTEFDRKNYFYPDLPKGYQLSQYEYPLVSGGELVGVAITRVHLEEDTASSVHDERGETLVDYNRAGVPLMELVTEPVITSAEQAGEFARELQLLLRYLGASNANMEKGEMRVEANISVAKKGSRGTKVEIKNLNSFRTMERAVAYEIERQTLLVESGGTVMQETRGWDEKKQATFAQRTKEGSADYRYFPDPDLPSLRLSQMPGYARAMLESGMPELPGERRARYIAMGIRHEDADSFVREPSLGTFFETVLALGTNEPKRILLVANYLANDLVDASRRSENGLESSRDIESRDTQSQAEIPISAHNFNKIIELLLASKISSRGAKDILAESIKTGADPDLIAKERGLFQLSGEAELLETVSAIIAANPAVAADYRSGKSAALEFLVGQCMKELKGAGNPTLLRKLLQEQLS